MNRSKRESWADKAVRAVVTSACALAAGVGVQAGPNCPPRYTVSVVPGPWCGFPFGYGNAKAWGGNDNGVMVGAFSCPGGQDQAFVSYDGSTLTPLDLPQGTSSSLALAINDSGQIGGQRATPDGFRVFLIDGEKVIDVDPLPGHNWVEFGGMNASGTIVGLSIAFGSGVSSSFKWHHGQIEDIGVDLPLKGVNRALGVSDSGMVTGFMGQTMFPYNYHAFIWDNGKVIDLGLPFPECFATEGTAINNQGHVCGRWWKSIDTAPFFEWRGFFYDGEQSIDIDLPDAEEIFPHDLNNADQIVGYAYYPGDSFTSAILWQNGTLFNLNDLVEKSSEPVYIRNALEITEDGLIYGYSFGTSAVRMTPLPPRKGDVDCDFDVDVDDLLKIINQWGFCRQGDSCESDLNVDGIVDHEDLAIVIADWSATP